MLLAGLGFLDGPVDVMNLILLPSGLLSRAVKEQEMWAVVQLTHSGRFSSHYKILISLDSY